MEKQKIPKHVKSSLKIQMFSRLSEIEQVFLSGTSHTECQVRNDNNLKRSSKNDYSDNLFKQVKIGVLTYSEKHQACLQHLISTVVFCENGTV